MKRLLVFGISATMLAACSKDKFKTTPTVEITSFGPSEAVKGNVITLTADVTDEEGDLQDSVIVYRKLYAVGSTTPLPAGVDSLIKANLSSLGVPAKRKIEVSINLVYGELRPEIGPIQNNDGCACDRELTIGLYVKDKAGHRSEYVESKRILLKKI